MYILRECTSQDISMWPILWISEDIWKYKNSVKNLLKTFKRKNWNICAYFRLNQMDTLPCRYFGRKRSIHIDESIALLVLICVGWVVWPWALTTGKFMNPNDTFVIRAECSTYMIDDIYRWCTQFNGRLQVYTKNAVVLERFAISGFTSQWWTVLSPGSCFKRRPVCWTLCDILDSLKRCITRFCKCLWEA